MTSHPPSTLQSQQDHLHRDILVDKPMSLRNPHSFGVPSTNVEASCIPYIRYHRRNQGFSLSPSSDPCIKEEKNRTPQSQRPQIFPCVPYRLNRYPASRCLVSFVASDWAIPWVAHCFDFPQLSPMFFTPSWPGRLFSAGQERLDSPPSMAFPTVLRTRLSLRERHASRRVSKTVTWKERKNQWIRYGRYCRRAQSLRRHDTHPTNPAFVLAPLIRRRRKTRRTRSMDNRGRRCLQR